MSKVTVMSLNSLHLALLLAAVSLASAADLPSILYVLDNGTVVVENLTVPAPPARNVSSEDMDFILYNKENEAGYKLKIGDVGNLKNSKYEYKILSGTKYKVYCPTKIIIHGLLGDVYKPMVQTIKNAYMETNCYNVIGVGYKKFNYPYLAAMSDASQIAGNICKLIVFLQKNDRIQIEFLHIIGHSLGAQIAGLVGQCIQVGKAKVGRITGLDPAGPIYERLPPIARLDASDAIKVDVIHSNTDYAGFNYSIGEYDFWPCGGNNQYRCLQYPSGFFRTACDHFECVQYFAESIKTWNKYPSRTCSNDNDARQRTCSKHVLALMGEWSIIGVPGIHYVDVDSILADAKENEIQ